MITVVELIARFWDYAQQYYQRPDGTQTSEVDNYRQALRPLKQLYGTSNANKFGPRALKAIRQRMINMGWCRSYINKHVNRLKHVFKWATAEELVQPFVYHGLQAVDGLKRGRSEARETSPVKPVPDGHVDAIKLHTSRQVWALVQLQLLTAARSGELVVMRPIDLNTTSTVWTYTPDSHKTAHHGHTRTIYIGPRGQQVIRPFLAGRPVDSYFFSPKEAEQERRAKQHTQRTTLLSCGNVPGSNRKRRPQREPGNSYTRDSYRRGIQRACRKAGIPEWFPHQLRHSSATIIRREEGIEVARIILGHRSAAITETYADLDHRRALQVMAKIG